MLPGMMVSLHSIGLLRMDMQRLSGCSVLEGKVCVSGTEVCVQAL
jgi:hypothetical protein